MNAPAQRIGKYEVQATVSKGPRATLYRAQDGNTGRVVAVKVIGKAHYNAAALPAYRKVGQALENLAHPGIAAWVDVVEHEGGVALVSETCEGVPLASLLKDGAHPDMKSSWDIARRMLEALAFAHARGAVHGGLDPSSVMLAAGGGLKIADFGAAMLMSGAPETVHYRAPEQFDPRGGATARTDIYNAGAIIYHLVTGKLPFTGTPAEIEHRVLQERPTDPSSYDNKIAWQLDWVIQKAMSKDPAERFAEATGFGEGLRLGMQDTVGRPLDPITSVAAQVAAATPPAGAPAAPKPAPTPVREPTKPPVEAVPPKAAPTPVREPTPPGEAAPTRLTLTPVAEPTRPVEATPQKAMPTPTPSTEPGKPPIDPAPPRPAPSLAQKAQALKAAAAVEKPPPAPSAPAERAAAKARVLFVDDDERILNAVRALFRQEYDVVIALGGEAAIASIREAKPHVIVSDQRMPGLTGVELLRQARTLAPDAVRMLLTGYTDLAALVGSINQGEIFRFVMKPWDNEELRKAVADAARIAIDLAATSRAAATAAAPAGTAGSPQAATAAASTSEGDKPAPPAPNPRSAGSILVIDPREGLAKGLERLLAGAAEVFQVDGPKEAAKVLHGREFAAIVADLGAGTDGLVALFKQLKEKRPEILSILIAEEPDSELGIELINKAQIYRFLPKPVSAKELRTQVAAALRRYATFKQIPALRGGAAPSAAVERARATPDRKVPGGG